MSLTGGQIAGAIIGTIVAIVTFNPAAGASIYAAIAVGASIGMSIGGIIDPPDGAVIKMEGPRIGDLNVQTAEWGQAIRRLFGTYRMSGNVIWSLPLHETKHVEESGEGKGGGGTQTETIWYSYAGSWAVGFCEGEVAGLKKIWFDSVLVYDGENYSGGLKRENHAVYLGSPDQLIDWYMDTGDTPAYRHLCYIVFRQIELENYGNRIPKVSCEIVKDGQDLLNNRLPDISLNHVLDHRIEGKVLNITAHSINLLKEDTSAVDFTFETSELLKYDGVQIDVKDHVKASGAFCPTPIGDFNSYTCNWGTTGAMSRGYSVEGNSYIANVANSTSGKYIMPRLDEDCCDTRNELYYATCYTFLKNNPSGVHAWVSYEKDKAVVLDLTNGWLFSLNHAVHNHFDQESFPTPTYVQPYLIPDIHYGYSVGGFDIGIYYTHINFFSDNVYVTTLLPSGIVVSIMTLSGAVISTKSSTNFLNINIGKIDNVMVDSLGFHITQGNAANNFSQYTFLDFNLNVIRVVPLQVIASVPVNPIKSYYNNGIVYVVHDDTGNLTPNNDAALFRWRVSDNLQSNEVPISQIADELFERAGLESTDYDTSEGTDSVHGYVIGYPMETRAAVTSLLSAYSYDLIENNGVLKLKKRNSTSIAIIDESEIINYAKIDRFQTIELSKMLNILYANKDNNYDVGSQSASRIDPDAINNKTYQYAIAMSDTQGKKLAELYLYSEWKERFKFQFIIPSEYVYLEPSNVVTLNHKGNSYVIRLTKVVYNTNHQIDCEGTIEDLTVYESTAEGSSTISPLLQTEVALTGPTNLEVLDIPMLDNAYNQEGVYIACDGYLSGWKGCGVSKSIDTEVTYSPVGQIINGTILGKTETVLSSGSVTAYDLTNSVTIRLYNSGAIYSGTWITLLGGANYILIGDEILQYKDVFDNGDGTFIISELLRGRRGTEWAIGTHVVNERAIVLDNDMMFDSTAALNVNTYYKATTFGDFIEDSISEYIVPEIRCLKPLSPSYVKLVREVNNDITITWMRRSRDVTGYMKTLQLFEETESYEVVVVGPARVLTSTTETVTYTEAQQTTDSTLGGPITVNVYQISGTVQRGYGTQGYIA